MNRPALVAAAALLLLCALSCSSSTVYVKWDSPGPTLDGSSWDTAFHTVQAGLNAAASGDKVWVARGTYVERITLKAGVGLYGGFAGAGSTKDIRAYQTILDGSAGGSVVTSPSGATASTVIDGFTIRNGTANYGAGINCTSSSPTIANNLIAGNHAASSGGGISCSSASSPLIVNNRITGNRANAVGGGIWCSSSSPTIANSVIGGNSASHGGGIYCYFPGSATITNNTIVGNTATSDGGGIRCVSSSPTVTNNIIAFGSSGIHNYGGTPVLRNNCLHANTAYDYSGLLPGTGDISADPMLASKEYGNFHIQPLSPCINAGLNTAPGLPALDMDGQPRIQGDIVDIGADESEFWPAGPYAIVRVSPSGDDTNDGSSWTLAKRTVQAGIDAAAALGGEVWVAAGTYNERIILHSYVYLYGGFSGTETQRSQRNWNAHRSILDGGAAGSVVTIRAGLNVSTIDGFTIRNGTGTPGAPIGTRGGGIYCEYSSPRIANNTITGNTASNGGAGICCNYASPDIDNNLISGNTAAELGSYSGGGGILCAYSSPRITRNTITGNVSTGTGWYDLGGGIFCDHSSPLIAHNTFTGNTSYSRGGAVACTSSTPVISGNIMTGNTATYGGGIYCEIASSPTFVNNTICGNSARYGGGIYIYGSSALIANNILAFNSSAIYKEAGTPVLRNNCFHGNTEYDYSNISAGIGDISADPLFVDRQGGDYHLTLNSPCVNAGWSDASGLPETDMDGESRILHGTADIGADECPATASAFRDAKLVADGVPVGLSEAIVTAVFDEVFYVEAQDRSCGIRVEKTGHGVEIGDRVNVAGPVRTNDDGERYIKASTVDVTGSGTVAPVHINGRALGGGDWFYHPSNGAGQCGVVGGLGLNNIGLLVTTWGKISYLDGAYCLNLGKDTVAGVRMDGLAAGDIYVRVTGISSCRRDADGLYPVILVTSVSPVE